MLLIPYRLASSADDNLVIIWDVEVTQPLINSSLYIKDKVTIFTLPVLQQIAIDSL